MGPAAAGSLRDMPGPFTVRTELGMGGHLECFGQTSVDLNCEESEQCVQVAGLLTDSKHCLQYSLQAFYNILYSFPEQIFSFLVVCWHEDLPET